MIINFLKLVRLPTTDEEDDSHILMIMDRIGSNMMISANYPQVLLVATMLLSRSLVLLLI